MNAFRRSGSARPSSFLAFFHDSLRRWRAARIVSRQHTSPNRSRTQPTRRRKVQRGAGSAPSSGGVAAVRWAAQSASPSSASRGGQKRDGGARAPERKRVGAVLVIGVHPAQHRVGSPARAQGHLGGATVLGDVKQGERTLAGLGVPQKATLQKGITPA